MKKESSKLRIEVINNEDINDDIDNNIPFSNISTPRIKDNVIELKPEESKNDIINDNEIKIIENDINTVENQNEKVEEEKDENIIIQEKKIKKEKKENKNKKVNQNSQIINNNINKNISKSKKVLSRRSSRISNIIRKSTSKICSVDASCQSDLQISEIHQNLPSNLIKESFRDYIENSKRNNGIISNNVISMIYNPPHNKDVTKIENNIINNSANKTEDIINEDTNNKEENNTINETAIDKEETKTVEDIAKSIINNYPLNKVVDIPIAPVASQNTEKILTTQRYNKNLTLAGFARNIVANYPDNIEEEREDDLNNPNSFINKIKQHIPISDTELPLYLGVSHYIIPVKRQKPKKVIKKNNTDKTSRKSKIERVKEKRYNKKDINVNEDITDEDVSKEEEDDDDEVNEMENKESEKEIKTVIELFSLDFPPLIPNPPSEIKTSDSPRKSKIKSEEKLTFNKPLTPINTIPPKENSTKIFKEIKQSISNKNDINNKPVPPKKLTVNDVDIINITNTNSSPKLDSNKKVSTPKRNILTPNFIIQNASSGREELLNNTIKGKDREISYLQQEIRTLNQKLHLLESENKALYINFFNL